MRTPYRLSVLLAIAVAVPSTSPATSVTPISRSIPGRIAEWTRILSSRRRGQLAVCLTIALVLSAASLDAAVPWNDAAVIPLPGLSPVGLAAAPDGTLWYAALDSGGTTVGLIRPDGSIAQKLIPHPFGNENSVAMLALPDGSVMVGSYNGLIARVDPQLQVTLFQRPSIYGIVTDFALGPDGNVWYVASVFGQGLLGTIAPAGSVQESVLPDPQSQAPLRVVALTSTSTAVYLATNHGVYRSATPGTVELVASCSCNPRWIEVMEDGTIWTSEGFVRPGDDLVTSFMEGEDATLGPDGNVWIVGPRNMIRSIDGTGSIREFPLRTMMDNPKAIVSAAGALWYGVNGEIRRLDPAAHVDLALRFGDIVTQEYEQNCCFEGVHPVLAHYRRSAEPFARFVHPRYPFATSVEQPGSVYVDHTARVLAAEWGDSLAALLDGLGEVSGRLPAPAASGPAGLVLDRAGTIHSIRYSFSDGGCRLVTLSAEGELLRDIACPVEPGTRVYAIDLAADQCTLFYAGHILATSGGVVGRLDVCTGTMLAPIDDLPTPVVDLRILPGGDVMAVSHARAVRYDADGAVVSEWIPDEEQRSFTAVAVDPDRRSVWLGTEFHLERIELETGQTIEQIPTYGSAVSISIAGEPRAARTSPKRRSVRR